MTSIGFIGLGVMGQSMANHLLQAGHTVYVYNRTKAKSQSLCDKGAIWVDTPKEIATLSDVVMTIVGYPKDVEEVYFGEQGLFAGEVKGKILIDLTTSTPTLARKIYEQGQLLEVATLDAPVSGGDLGAKEGRLTCMVGGDLIAFEKASPLLKCFSAKVNYFGPAGSGQHTKMANQIMIAGTMTGMIELLRYAQAAQLDLEKVIETVGAGSASNWSLLNYAPRILKNDDEPGFFSKHFLKDLKIALDEAEKMGLDLPFTQQAAKAYEQLCQNGYENKGTQALIRLWWE